MKASTAENLGYCQLKQLKPWFDEECLKLLDHRKQVKLQWLQNPSHVNGNNVNDM